MNNNGLKVGDHVRWWPDASAEFPVERCTRWIDGDAERVDDRGRVVSLIATEFQGYQRGCEGIPHYVGNKGIVALRVAADCRNGGPCQMPASGGACTRCGYPVAFAHPDCVEDALEHVGALYVNGTALVIRPSLDTRLGFVLIYPNQGSPGEWHAIPGWADGLDRKRCWVRWTINRRCIEHPRPVRFQLTPEQIALAKEYDSAWLSSDWSAALRELVQRSEAERLAREPRVVMPDPDLETANAAIVTDDEFYAYNQRRGC